MPIDRIFANSFPLMLPWSSAFRKRSLTSPLISIPHYCFFSLPALYLFFCYPPSPVCCFYPSFYPYYTSLYGPSYLPPRLADVLAESPSFSLPALVSFLRAVNVLHLI